MEAAIHYSIAGFSVMLVFLWYYFIDKTGREERPFSPLPEYQQAIVIAFVYFFFWPVILYQMFFGKKV
jgi:hypothetical protein